MTKIKENAQTAKTLKTLAPFAVEITKEWQAANVADTEARDHRLKAVIALGKAKKACEAAKIDFKSWVETTLRGVMAWNTARQMAAVGLAPKPAEALAKLRADNADRNKKARKANAGGKKSGKSNSEPAPTIAAKSPLQVALAAILLIKDNAPELGDILRATLKRGNRETALFHLRQIVTDYGFKLSPISLPLNEAPTAPSKPFAGITSPEKVKAALQSVKDGTAFKPITPPTVPTPAAIEAAGKGKRSRKGATAH